jgi:hypothetical protein
LGFNFVIFEIDSQTLVNSFNSNNLRVSEFNSFEAASIREFNSFVKQLNSQSLLSNFDVEFVIRQTNMVGHLLERADESSDV